jgi:DNA-binding transcriptional MerR regulator
VETILIIKHLLHEKRFTIEGAKQYLRQNHFMEQPEFIREIENDVHQDYSDNHPTSANLLKEVYLELQKIRDLLV